MPLVSSGCFRFGRLPDHLYHKARNLCNINNARDLIKGGGGGGGS